jgi:hypothetical protein
MSESLTLTVIPLMGLELPLLPGPGVKVISNRTETVFFPGAEIYLSNNPDTISGLLGKVNPEFLKLPALQKVQEATGIHSLLYSFDLKPGSGTDEVMALCSTATRYRILCGIEHALWRVKDNNVSLWEMWFLDSAGTTENWGPLHLNTNCEGMWLGGTEFTEDELATAIGFLNGPMWHDELFLGIAKGYVTIYGGNIVHSEDTTRIRRCLTVGDIGLRVVMYVTCLETLFSTDASELTHKLAERVAWFIGEDTMDRMEVFANVKRVYDVRSKIIHGAVPKGECEKLVVEAKSADHLLRKIVNKIYGHPECAELFLSGCQSFEEHRQSFEKYFNHLVFDRPPSIV